MGCRFVSCKDHLCQTKEGYLCLGLPYTNAVNLWPPAKKNGCWWFFHAKTSRAEQRRAIYAGTFRTRYSESLGIVRGSATLSNCKDRTLSDNKHIHVLGETPFKASLHSSGCRSRQNVHLKLLLDILIKYGRCVSRLHIISSLLLLPRAISVAVILVTETINWMLTIPWLQSYILVQTCAVNTPQIPILKASPCTVRRGGEVAVALKGIEVGHTVLAYSILPRQDLLYPAALLPQKQNKSGVVGPKYYSEEELP